MNARVQRKMGWLQRKLVETGWKGGVLFVALCVVLGLLAGAVITKAQGAVPTGGDSARSPACAYDGASCVARVYSKRDGVRKFRHVRLGHAADRMKYPPRLKRIFTAALVKAQRRNNRTARVADTRTAAQLWRNFTNHDDCVMRAQGAGAYAGRPMTCQAATDFIMNHKTRKIDKNVIRGAICGTITGIGIGGAIATGATTGPGAPWVWAGIGAAGLACMWSEWLISKGGRTTRGP